MDPKIKEVIRQYRAYKGRSVPAVDASDDEYIDIIIDRGEYIDQIDRDSHRWWDTFVQIKKFQTAEDKVYFIGYEFASANRDESIYDLGYEFDPDTISFYKEYEVIRKDYEQLTPDEVEV
jgi:hypothetical protein